MIPQQALHAERQAKALERELAEIKQLLQRQQPQTKQEPAPDPLAAFVSDPTAFFQQQVTPVQQQMSEMREMVQELHAAQAHGLDKVAAAKQAAEEMRDAGDPRLPSLIGRLQRAANPSTNWSSGTANRRACPSTATIPRRISTPRSSAGWQRRHSSSNRRLQAPPTFRPHSPPPAMARRVRARITAGRGRSPKS